MDGKSSGSGMSIATESGNENGRRSGGRKRKSVLGDKMKIGEEEENDRMERTHSGSERRRGNGKKIVPSRRKKTLETSPTLRSQKSLPKTTRRMTVLKESDYEIK